MSKHSKHVRCQLNTRREIPYLQATMYYFVYYIKTLTLDWQEKLTLLTYENKRIDNLSEESLNITVWFSNHNMRKFWQTKMNWEWWRLCRSFINLTEWQERLIGNIKHTWKNTLFCDACCYSFSLGLKSSHTSSTIVYKINSMNSSSTFIPTSLPWGQAFSARTQKAPSLLQLVSIDWRS